MVFYPTRLTGMDWRNHEKNRGIVGSSSRTTFFALLCSCCCVLALGFGFICLSFNNKDRGRLEVFSRKEYSKAIVEKNSVHEMPSFLYRGWLGKNNSGDEAVFDIFRLLLAKTLGRLGQQHRNTPIERRILENTALSKIDIASSMAKYFVMGGGSLLDDPSDYLVWAKRAIDAGLTIYFHGTGTQLQGGNLTKYLNGMTSFFGGVRGPLSQRKMESQLKGIRMPIILDSGLILNIFYPKVNMTKDRTLAQLRGLKESSGKEVILFSCTYPSSMSTWSPKMLDSHMKTLQYWGQIISKLSHQFITILFCVDLPAIAQNEFIIEESLLHGGNTNHIHLLPFREDWALVLEAFIIASVTVSARLHPLVFSAAAHTPFLPLIPIEEVQNPRGKYGDFLASINYTLPQLHFLKFSSSHHLHDCIFEGLKIRRELQWKLKAAQRVAWTRHHEEMRSFVQDIWKNHQAFAKKARNASVLCMYSTFYPEQELVLLRPRFHVLTCP